MKAAGIINTGKLDGKSTGKLFTRNKDFKRIGILLLKMSYLYIFAIAFKAI